MMRKPKDTRRLVQLPFELRRDQLVYHFWVCFAAGRLHHLTDKPTRKLGVFAGFCHLIGVGRDNVVNGCFDCTGVGDLLHPARFDDLRRVSAFGQ